MDFGADRDDCHLAAWEEASSDLSPLARELMTLLQNGRSQPIPDIIQQQARRGFEDAMFGTAVAQLQTQHFLEQSNGKIQLTKLGIKKREAVEQITNETFYRPWNVALSTEKIHNLVAHLQSLTNR